MFDSNSKKILKVFAERLLTRAWIQDSGWAGTLGKENEEETKNKQKNKVKAQIMRADPFQGTRCEKRSLGTAIQTFLSALQSSL